MCNGFVALMLQVIVANDAYGNPILAQVAGQFSVEFSYNDKDFQFFGNYSDDAYSVQCTFPHYFSHQSTDVLNGVIRYSTDAESVEITQFESILTPKSFAATIHQENAYFAGESIVLTVDTDDDSPFHLFTVNGVDLTSEVMYNETEKLYHIPVGSYTEARLYISEVSISSPGLIGGTRYLSFNVLAGVPFPGNSVISFTADLQSSVAGEEVILYLRLMDVYGNAVGVDYSPAIGVFYGENQLENAFFAATAHYETSFVAQESGTYELYMELTGERFWNESVTVSPSDFSFAQSVVISNTSAVANESVVFQVYAKDQYGNVRSDSVDEFLFSINDASIPYVSFGNGTYSAEWNSTVSGEYVFKVSFWKQVKFITLRAFTVEIRPGQLYPLHSVVSGSALVSGVEKTRMGFSVIGKDVFNNTVEDVADAKFLSIVYTESRSGSISPCDYLGSGEWNCTYVTPEIVDNATDYAIEVYHYTDLLDESSMTRVFESAAVATVRPVDIITIEDTDYTWYIVTAIGVFLLLVLASVYMSWRLRRYRKKYKIEHEKAEDLGGRLEDMYDEQKILPGGKDWQANGAGVFTLNPLHAMYQTKVTSEEIIEEEPERDEDAPIRMEFRGQR